MDDTPRETFTIAEAARRSGVTATTLRYYEQIGLLGRVPRARSGHRRFGPDEVRWVTFLRRMQATGMPIRDMLAYAALVRRGPGTEAARMALLVAHEAAVVERLAELTASLEAIRHKIALYGGALGTPLAPKALDAGGLDLQRARTRSLGAASKTRKETR